MAESTESHDQARQKTWKRRGLFAAAAAVIAGLVTKATEQRVEAGTDGDVVLGGTNTATTATTINNASELGTALVVAGTNGMSTGLSASGSHFGVWASASETAVFGTAIGTGVTGSAEVGMGVAGVATSGVGVYGNISSQGTAATMAIYGVNNSSYVGPWSGAGGFGVVGSSLNGHGVVGVTAKAGAAAVAGTTNGLGGAYAGAFWGPVFVAGDFLVTGGKSAAVPHPDGTHRRLYCVESPESWFEDFGKGQLACGQADVELDPDFAAMVDLDDYHVFLTAYDADHVLHVTNQTKAGFRVQAQHEAATGRFSWRVVAKRKDIAAPRFETVMVPAGPVVRSVAEPAVPPPSPDTRSRFRSRG